MCAVRHCLVWLLWELPAILSRSKQLPRAGRDSQGVWDTPATRFPFCLGRDTLCCSCSVWTVLGEGSRREAEGTKEQMCDAVTALCPPSPAVLPGC